MSFLMVGHTHEDIDQRFSKYAHKLKLDDAKTFTELTCLLERSMEPKPEITTLQTVWNIRDWLSPCLEEIHNQSFPHVYRIFMGASGDVKIQYKNWSTDDTWMPGDGMLEIFKKENGAQIIPTGLPETVPMVFKEDDIKAVKQGILKSKDVLNFAQYEWWMRLLQNLEAEVRRTSNQSTNWCLQGMSTFRKVTPPAQSTSPETTEVIQRLLTKEREGRQVTNALRRQTGIRQNRIMLNTPARSRPVVKVPIATGNTAIFSNDEAKVIGKVAERTKTVVSLEVFRDTGGGVYRPVTRANGAAFVKITQLGCILHTFKQLTTSHRLPGDTARILEGLRNK